MFRNKKYFIITVLIVFIAISIYFSFFYQQNNIKSPASQSRSSSEQKTTPDGLLKDINFSLFNNDQTVRWKIIADQAVQYQDKNRMRLIPVNVKAFDQETEKLLYTFKGEKGVYLNSQGKLTIEGSVRVDRDSYNLTASKLIWLQNQDEIKGLDGVKITGPSFILEGEKLNANSKFTHLVIKGSETKQAHFKWERRDVNGE